MNEKKMLIRYIENLEPSYNPEMRAVTEPFSSPGYHTTLTSEIGNVHKTRIAATYALALLDSGEDQYLRRACDVLERLVHMQDKNPESPTFGIWSWFYEEPLARMSPPDWNWADFIGKPLLLTLKRHGDRLPSPLKADIEQAVRHACKAIMIRNVGPHYTNIAIMGAFVTLAAGEWLQEAEVEAYGLARLQRFYDYTMESGTFQEFNSPTYTTIAIEELSSIRTETGRQDARELADRLLDVAWRMVAERFHPSTKQWAGPHTRAYSDLLTAPILSFLQLSLKGAVSWLTQEELQYNPAWYKNEIRCPDPYAALFVAPRIDTRIQELLQEHSRKRRYAVTYTTRDYTLGTMSSGDLWNQRRSLVAYASTPKGPVYVRLRALLNGYDYTGAILLAAQREGHALFGIPFATDGGNRHPSLDLIREHTITASDLRIRFEIGGAVEAVEASWAPDASDGLHRFVGRIGEIPLHILVSAAAFGEESIRYETHQEGGSIHADLILYRGEQKPIRLTELRRAVVAGQFSIGGEPLEMDTVVREESCSLQAYGQSGESDPELRIMMPIRPAGLRELTEASIVDFIGMEAGE